MTPLLFIILILACWRLSSMFANEKGPSNIFVIMRNIYKVDCLWCLTVWFSALVLIFAGLQYLTFVNWLAISAGAIFFEEAINKLNRK